jgi:hypothetical protein
MEAMMAVATFDTLKFANTLKAAGVPDKQAEAQAVAFQDVIQLNLDNLPNKDDLESSFKSLRDEIKHSLIEQETRLNAKLELFAQKYRSEQIIIRIMLGFLITICTGIFIRMFFMKGAF